MHWTAPPKSTLAKIAKLKSQTVYDLAEPVTLSRCRNTTKSSPNHVSSCRLTRIADLQLAVPPKALGCFLEKNGTGQYDSPLRPARVFHLEVYLLFELDTEVLWTAEWHLYILSWTAKAVAKHFSGPARQRATFQPPMSRCKRGSSSSSGLGLPRNATQI